MWNLIVRSFFFVLFQLNLLSIIIRFSWMMWVHTDGLFIIIDLPALNCDDFYTLIDSRD